MRRTLLAVLFAAAWVGLCFASRVSWDSSKRPPMSIVQGHEIALKALGKDAGDFYCLSGIIFNDSWNYRFSSQKGETRLVVVSFDGKAKVQDHETGVY